MISRLFKEATAVSSGNDCESSFDEKYTLDHPPQLRTQSFADETGWPSVASTRTPAGDKVAINMQISGQHGNDIVSVGYLNELTRGPGDIFSVSAKSGKSNKFSTGFLTYVHDKYQHSSRRKQLLVWSFFCVFLFLAVVSGVMAVMAVTGSLQVTDHETNNEVSGPMVVQQFPQKEVGPSKDVAVDVALASSNSEFHNETDNAADIPTAMPVKTAEWSGNKYEITTDENTTKMKFTISPTASSSTSPSEFRYHGSLFDESASPSRKPVTRYPSPQPATINPPKEPTYAPATSRPTYAPV